MGRKEITGQMSIFDFIPEPEAEDEWHLPCDTCGYDVKGCCAFENTPEDFCRLGDKWILKDRHNPMSVDIKGICDDAYCPICGYQFWYPEENDKEYCPECGQRMDWKRWHEVNDEEMTNDTCADKPEDQQG